MQKYMCMKMSTYSPHLYFCPLFMLRMRTFILNFLLFLPFSFSTRSKTNILRLIFHLIYRNVLEQVQRYCCLIEAALATGRQTSGFCWPFSHQITLLNTSTTSEGWCTWHTDLNNQLWRRHSFKVNNINCFKFFFPKAQ